MSVREVYIDTSGRVMTDEDNNILCPMTDSSCYSHCAWFRIVKGIAICKNIGIGRIKKEKE